MKGKRTRGEGSVFKRPGSKFWWIRFYVRSVAHRESSFSEKESVAATLLRKRLAEIDNGSFVDPTALKKTCLPDLEQMVLTNYALNKLRSADSVAASFKRLRAYFGDDRPVATITTRDVEAFKEAQQQLDVPGGKGRKTADATINRCLSALRRGFTLARKAKVIADGPLIETLTEDNARSGFLEHSDFLRLRSKLGDLADAIEFLYYSGWRVGEMRSLTWADVNATRTQITLQAANSKNKRRRTLALGPELRLIIERADANQQETGGHIFLRANGKPIEDFRKAWRIACNAAGLPTLLVHDLRRTCVRNLIRAGVPQSVAMKQTGHRTISTFLRYDIADDTDARDAQDKLSAHLNEQPSTLRKVVPIRSAS